MPRPADDRAESDESSDDDTDRDGSRSIQESLAEARQSYDPVAGSVAERNT